MTRQEQWGIIGGGVLGMTLATRLAQAGHHVTVLEGASQIGGLASTWQIGDLTWDKHYHVILLSDRHLRGILDELGLADETNWVETKTGCYTDGELYSVSNTIEFLRFPPLRLIDKLRLGWTIWYCSKISDWKSLENESVEDWLVRHSGQRTFDKFWLPLLKSKLGENYRLASAAFIWAIIQRLYAARRTGLKKEMFGYVSGGYATILAGFSNHLADIGVDVVLNSKIARITSEPSGIGVESSDGSRVFDRVVTTTAPAISARLIAGLREGEIETMNGITYQGIVCASLLLSQPLDKYYVTNITDDWPPFTGVIEMSTLVDPAQFDGQTLVYLPRYTTQGDPALEWSDDETKERFLDALDRMYPDFKRSHVNEFKISRVRYVLPVSTLGYSDHIQGFETSIPGIYTVNSSQVVNGTLNVNETIELAERAAEFLLSAEKSRTAPAWTPIGGEG